MPITRNGPTPLGGVRSVAYLFDADGNPTDDPDRARSGEIHEFAAEGDLLGRTYFQLSPPAADSIALNPPTNAGLVYTGNEPDLGNDDAKATWDLWIPGWKRKVERLPELLHVLGLDDATTRQQHSALCHFMELPAWGGAPGGLKDEVYSWLEANRQE